jgi:hypothetical protein
VQHRVIGLFKLAATAEELTFGWLNVEGHDPVIHVHLGPCGGGARPDSTVGVDQDPLVHALKDEPVTDQLHPF